MKRQPELTIGQRRLLQATFGRQSWRSSRWLERLLIALATAAALALLIWAQVSE